MAGLFGEWAKKAEAFDISNVTEWLLASPDREDWAVGEESFACLLPPFKHVCMESRAPDRMVSDLLSLPPTEAAKKMPRRWAIFMSCFTVEEARSDYARIKDEKPGTVEEMYAMWLKRGLETINNEEQAAMARYVCIANIFLMPHAWAPLQEEAKKEKWPEDTIMGPLGTMVWTMDSVGTPLKSIGSMWGSAVTLIQHGFGMLKKRPVIENTNFAANLDMAQTEIEDSYVKAAKLTECFLLNPALMATTMLNCKNVRTEIVEPPKKNNEVRAKRGKPPLLRYHVLVIDPFKKSVRREESTPTGRVLSLHVVRGHLKDYREGKGLFGKYKGLWWWEPSMAGSADVGTVVKDYEVKGGT
jgi:hypothetical protein